MGQPCGSRLLNRMVVPAFAWIIDVSILSLKLMSSHSREWLGQLSNTQYFTTLDLAAGYWQVLVEPKSREKTAFVTHSGLLEFSVMPFGLKNAPATFQRLMETVLSGLIRDVCLDYLDDIIVTGRTCGRYSSAYVILNLV